VRGDRAVRGEGVIWATSQKLSQHRGGSPLLLVADCVLEELLFLVSGHLPAPLWYHRGGALPLSLSGLQGPS
jgi:hypothetical protein